MRWTFLQSKLSICFSLQLHYGYLRWPIDAILKYTQYKFLSSNATPFLHFSNSLSLTFVTFHVYYPRPVVQNNVYKRPSERLQGSYVPLPEVKHANPVCNIVLVVILPAGQYGSTSIIYRKAQKGMWKLESAVMNCQVSELSGVILQSALPAPLILTMFSLLLRDTPLLRPLTNLQVHLSYYEMFHKLNISDVTAPLHPFRNT